MHAIRGQVDARITLPLKSLDLLHFHVQGCCHNWQRIDPRNQAGDCVRKRQGAMRVVCEVYVGRSDRALKPDAQRCCGRAAKQRRTADMAVANCPGRRVLCDSIPSLLENR